MMAKYNLNCPNGRLDDNMAPMAAPGMANDAIRTPRPYFILCCLEYATVEDREVNDTGIRLVLAICAGKRPINVNAGETMMPPPTPTIAPIIPANVPMTTITTISSIKYSTSQRNEALLNPTLGRMKGQIFRTSNFKPVLIALASYIKV